ncbi:hypothetical protein RRG08_019976 [Elysia crispata]|uniref:Uncharacterized protein n=1 Tax=Elysia crispata TaxID=231223 RepID=A0AAE1EDM7_9GAST|nr:hypothetical protein RRG08_019976 [Elysia crispata]
MFGFIVHEVFRNCAGHTLKRDRQRVDTAGQLFIAEIGDRGEQHTMSEDPTKVDSFHHAGGRRHQHTHIRDKNKSGRKHRVR